MCEGCGFKKKRYICLCNHKHKTHKAMTTGTNLKNRKHGYIVTFKCMVNEREFRTADDFQFFLSDFDVCK